MWGRLILMEWTIVVGFIESFDTLKVKANIK